MSMKRMLNEEERELVLGLNSNSRKGALEELKALQPETEMLPIAITVIKQTIGLLEEMTDDEYLAEVLL